MRMGNRFGLGSLLLAAMLALAGCGGGAPAGDAGNSNAHQPAAEQKAEPATQQQSAGSAAKPAEQPPAKRVIQHAMGETEVSANPQRVVVLDMGELDMVLALGVQPVGAAFYRLDQPLPSYLKDMVKGELKQVGTVGQPNLEAIAALKPDLILSNKSRHEKIYDKLSQIAPTVIGPGVGVAWKGTFAVVADALNKKAEHDQVMKAYDDRLAEFKQNMGDKLKATEVSLVRSFPDHVRLYLKASFSGLILEDAGLPRPQAQDRAEFADRLKVPEEHIPEMDGDVMFVMYYNKGAGEQISKLQQNPLWAQLKAVKAGRVYELDDEVWGTGLGPTAARLAVEDLFKYLLQ